MVPLEVSGQLRRPVHRLPHLRLGIRARLFLLALVTLSPLVGVLVFQDYYHLVAARQRADADVARLATIVPALPPYVDGVVAFTTAGEYLGGGWRTEPGRQPPRSALQDQVADS